MARSKWFLLLAGMMLGGCASGPYVVNNRDQFSDESIVSMQENKLTGLSEMGDFTFNIQKFSKSGHDDRFNLNVIWQPNSNSLLTIKPVESLNLLVDAEALNYSSKDGSRDNKGTTYGALDVERKHPLAIEKAVYENVPKADLEKIANAREVKVQIVGVSGRVSARFGPENFKAFQEFLKGTLTVYK